jgi:predicted PurR-regulated permease PerM
VRTILASIGLVLGTALLLLLIREVQRILVWIVIAGFFAVALYPVVNWIKRHAPWCRRSLATLVVYLLLVALIGELITLFVVRWHAKEQPWPTSCPHSSKTPARGGAQSGACWTAPTS